MAVNTSTKQMALLQDTGPGGFMERVQAMLVACAVDVLSEPGGTPYHGSRANYAQRVVQSPQMAVNQGGTIVVMGDSVTAGTTYDEETKKSTCTIDDGNLQAQIERQWNALAGIDTPEAPSIPAR